MADDTAPPSKLPRGARRRIGLALITVVVLVSGIAYGAWWMTTGRWHVSTDNAYVQGNLVQVTPQVAGTVLAILADDTDLVKAGQPLVTLDPSDARVALEQARAQLGQAVREVRAAFANDSTFAAGVAQREAEVARARTDVARTSGDLERREALLDGGAVSLEDVQHARGALENARAGLAAAQAAVVVAREQLAANRTLTDGASVETHPNVLRAAARVREAWLAVARSGLPAPVGGWIARRSVQVGQRVQAGTPVMAIAPLEQVWVEANFKEQQLRDMRIGQPVRLTADLYGAQVEFTGRVAGLAAGTGAAFALLPAQNATGNWIKVVQRLPVRIALDPKQVAEHPLRIGLSMIAEVDLHDRGGPVLASAPREQTVAKTDVFEGLDKGADDDVRAVIAANLGRRAGRR